MTAAQILRRSSLGRKALATINLVGAQCARLLFAVRRGPQIVDGCKMYLSGKSGPSPSFAMALLSGKYEWETRQVLEKVVKSGMTVLDVGAHVGYYALLFARWVGPAGRVFAFEAAPDNYSLLRRNVELSGCGNVVCIPKAISDHSGAIRFFVSSQGNDRNSIFENPRSLVQEASLEVPAVSLDEFLADQGWPHIDLIKMDVEGAEPLVLQGMAETVHRSPQLKVAVELAPEALRAGGHEAIELLKTLVDYGFGISSIESDGSLTVWGQDQLPMLADSAERAGMVNLFCERGK